MVFFRISELTKGVHVVKAVDVHISLNKSKLMFVLRSSKTHGLYAKPQIIIIAGENIECIAEQQHKQFSRKLMKINPFRILQKYIRARRDCILMEEQFFVFRDRSPITATQARMVLRKLLIKANFNFRNYSFHSLCSGRMTDLAKMGVPVSTIQKLGRWKSNAVYQYLKE